MICLMKRSLSGLMADDEAAAKLLRNLNPGDVVKVDIQKPRSHKNLRRWWALINMIYQNSDQFKSPEQAHDYLKILSGHCSQIVSKTTGEVYLVADSIAFGRLDEDEFQEVWARAVKAVSEHILPGVSETGLEQEILQIIGAASFK
jgi:TusA-related sulfurtransferase